MQVELANNILANPPEREILQLSYTETSPDRIIQKLHTLVSDSAHLQPKDLG